jgi:uncharacterized protein (TIGR03435 family)
MNELVFHLAMIALVGSVTAVQVTGAQRQTRDDVRATFDVASVKTNKNGQGPFRIGFEGGTFTATNVTVRQLVAMAFGAERSLPAYQLVGGPNWIDSDRFDIVAKGMAGAGQGANLSMLQALLKERFGLVVHSATQSLPSYALTVARNGSQARSRASPHVRRLRCLESRAREQASGSGGVETEVRIRVCPRLHNRRRSHSS